MAADSDRRRELAEFPKSRRSNVSRAEVGLPGEARGRACGLRREEVSFLSGVSITWYTWLEQARDINPSRQVLDAIACTLRLSVTERAYVLQLAGFSAADLGSLDPAWDAPPCTTAARRFDRVPRVRDCPGLGHLGLEPGI